MSISVGSLCTGYGGLDLAVESLLGGETAWVSEFDKHAAKVCEARFPGAPNLGDLTMVDWSAVEAVDVLTAGYPCQPFSQAGKRRGVDDDRHIWPFIAAAIRALRPRLVVLENVAGHVSLGLDAVLGDLAALGFDAEWGTVRASDVGAPHRRERIFIVAVNTAGAGRQGRAGQGVQSGEPSEGREPATNTEGDEQREHTNPGQVWAKPGHGARDNPATDTDSTGLEGRAVLPERASEQFAGSHSMESRWGAYAPAIQRWATIIGRPAPNPTTTGRTGRPVLNPVLVEWMMGLPEGWVTDLDLSRNQQLKILGNGVVPQQAAAAVGALL